MSAPVPVSTWHELRALVAEGGCAAAALPASVVVDGPVPVGPGRSLDVMGCATSMRFAPGVSQM